MQSVICRRANIDDLAPIIILLADDELGKTREVVSQEIKQSYLDAFERISSDQNHYLMVLEYKNNIIATCHLTILPSLTFSGATRMQIESVRVASNYRRKGIGKQMIEHAIQYGKERGASIIQLSADKIRQTSIMFYKSLGFKDTHEGMKMYL